MRCWQQQQRWRERDKFNRHFCSQNGRTCWWRGGREQESLHPYHPAWVAGCGWGHEMKEMQEHRRGAEGSDLGDQREQTSCDTLETCLRCPEPKALASASRLKPSLASDPAILDLPCLLRSSSLTLRSLYKRCQPCIVCVLAWRHRSHTGVKWKLWSSTVSGWQCVSAGADGNER